MRVELGVSVTLEDLIEALRFVNHETLVEFVKNLDISVADWGFTESLYRYFLDEHEAFLEEAAND